MSDHTDCKNYDDCDFRNDVGWCPESCRQYKHKDDVRVVRCKDCRYWKLGPMYHGCECPHGGMNLAVGTDGDEYCSYSERRDDG